MKGMFGVICWVNFSTASRTRAKMVVDILAKTRRPFRVGTQIPGPCPTEDSKLGAEKSGPSIN